MLALKQMQRAAQFAEQVRQSLAAKQLWLTEWLQKNGEVSDRAIKTEEEILLFYRILEAHGSDAEWETALKGPTLNPVYQFKAGRKDLFLHTIQVLERMGKWKTVYDLCKECLSATNDKDQLSLLACDWTVWKKFLNAAGRIGESLQE